MRFYFREGSVDNMIFEEVVTNNEYQLPDSFSENDIIVDIGAHAGFFTYAVIQRGAGKVHAIEADVENYELALEHLKKYITAGVVSLTWGAVWRSDVNEEVLYHGGYTIAIHNLVNTAGGDVIWYKHGKMVPAIPFDMVIQGATENGIKKIRLLKLDCEGSEWPILFTSNTLYLIDEMCGEFHEIGGEYDTHTPPFIIEGFERFTIHELIGFLQTRGFNVTYSRHISSRSGTLSNMGMFFAKRATLDN
jgi:FkbM family methyltransferase